MLAFRLVWRGLSGPLGDFTLFCDSALTRYLDHEMIYA